MLKDTREVFEKVEGLEGEMIDFMGEIISIPALSPENGGEGEERKVERILSLTDGWGFDAVERYDAPDERVPSGRRPNVLLRVRGEDPALHPWWIFVHTDVVPPGDLSLWESDPWKIRVEGGKIYGRGTEDNGQELVATLFGMRAILEMGLRPRRDVNIFLVADEETGSEKGLKHILTHHMELFNPGDLYIVPDSGNESGTLIEVAEKSILWVKIETYGKQVHASLPTKGLNAHLLGMKYALKVREELMKRFSKRDELYDVPYSTFEPTRKEENVGNVNTIPGKDVVYFDCRVLPEYSVKDVIEVFKDVAEGISEGGGRVEVKVVNMEEAAPPTNPDSPVVNFLKEAVSSVYGVEAQAGGIGGGTCAAILRKAGLPAAVWSRIDDMAHMPNEYARVENLVGDAKVYSYLFLH